MSDGTQDRFNVSYSERGVSVIRDVAMPAAVHVPSSNSPIMQARLRVSFLLRLPLLVIFALVRGCITPASLKFISMQRASRRVQAELKQLQMACKYRFYKLSSPPLGDPGVPHQRALSDRRRAPKSQDPKAD